MDLKSSPKIFNNYKCEYPENTIRNIKNGLEEIGLKLKYKEIVIQSTDFSSYSGDLFLEDFGFKTTGKGISPILAKASAYAEMAERISSGFVFFYTLNSNIEKYYQLLEDIINRKFLRGLNVDEDFTATSFEKINQFFQDDFDFEQYKLLKENGVFDVLVDSYSLINNSYLKTPIHFIESASGSNGLAAGNTIEEAIFQGACEVFERYAACEIVSNKIICPTIDINTIQDERIQNFIEMLNSLNIEVLVKDFTLNNKIPVIGVLFTNNNIKDVENPLKKARYYKMINPGSHLDLKEAIIRCLVERLQEVTKEELMYRKEADVLYDFWIDTLKKEYKTNPKAFKHFYRQFYFYGDLSFLESGPVIPFKEVKNTVNDDFYKDIKCIKEICIQNNWDLQVIDCTHKTINLPAVRVIIPPISTDTNPYVRQFIEFKNIEEQFNFLYGIKDFFNFNEDDKWINNQKSIKDLIRNIQDSLSEDLFSFELYLRRGPFYQCINLFHILAFCNLAIGNNDESLKYLEFLEKQLSEKNLKIDYFNELNNPGFDSSIYNKFISLIKEKSNEKSNSFLFNFTSNPFLPEVNTEVLENKKDKIVEKYAKSYF